MNVRVDTDCAVFRQDVGASLSDGSVTEIMTVETVRTKILNIVASIVCRAINYSTNCLQLTV